MINIKVDEAYAFDYLSILEIKKHINNQSYKNWKTCYNFLEEQLGKLFIKKIVNSKEYKNLISKNQDTFNNVNRAKLGKITAKKLYQTNITRYKAKIKLQKKFFKKNLKEVKI